MSPYGVSPYGVSHHYGVSPSSCHLMRSQPVTVTLWDVVTLWGVTLWGGTLQLSPYGSPEGHLMGWHLTECHLMGCHPMGCHHMGPLIVTLWVVTSWGITLWDATLQLSPYGTPEHCPMGCHLMGPLIVTLWGGTLQLSPNEIPAYHCHLMGCHPPVVTLWDPRASPYGVSPCGMSPYGMSPYGMSP